MLERVNVSLLGELLDNVAVWSDNQDGWPVIKLEGVPDIELAVVDACMFDIVPDDRLPKDVSCFLFIKLGTMYSNKCNFREIFKLCFEFLQFRQDMNTIYTAARPEIDDQELAFELVFHRQRLIFKCVEPF